MKRAIVTLAAAVLGVVLVLVSLPWVVWATGRMLCGDDAGFDSTVDRMPLGRYIYWLEARGV